MRKETSNQFTEGLVSDLNPINTPNTVLTDALNATIITYDGNEHSLQNDRGNYPLENCRLKPNYIPVGIKEYGDILYIVSYNPLNEHVEIGTYPSPLQIESSKTENTNLTLPSIIENANYREGKIKYSELVEDSQLKIWTSDNEEDSKLYPGDIYNISKTETVDYKYETLEYFIIDENRQKYNISDLIKIDGRDHNVAWQIPGWLAAQYRLGTFDNFIMSLRSVKAPVLESSNSFDCTLNLNFQFRISDSLFLPITSIKEADIKTDLGIELKVNNISEDVSLSDSNFLDWYSDSKILWVDTTRIVSNVSFGQTINIEAIPYVKVAVGGTIYKILYDSFTEKYNIYLNSVGSFSDFDLGKEIWKFYIDYDAKDQLYIEYDVTGPIVTNSDVQLYYRVLDLHQNVLANWTKVDNYVGVTNQGVGILNFNEEFQAEAIYILEFAFCEPKENIEELTIEKPIKKLVIASQIFSGFVGTYSNFNEIGFDDWISKYKDSIKSGDWNITYTTESKEPYSNFTWNKELHVDGVIFSDSLKKLWNKNYNQEDKGVFEISEANNLSEKILTLLKGDLTNLKIEASHNTEVLVGKLWEGAPSIKMKISGTEDSSYDRKSLSEDKSIDKDVNVVLGKSLDIKYQKESEFEYLTNIQRLEAVPVMHLHARMRDKNANQTIETTLRTHGFWPNIVKSSGTIQTTLEDGGSYIKLGNKLSKEIKAELGSAQVGVLCVTLWREKGAGKFQLRHGETPLWSESRESNTQLFTYLVVRKSDTFNNGVVLIPLKDHHNLWDVTLADGEQDTLIYNSSKSKFNPLTEIETYIDKLSDGLVICNKKNALSKNCILNIQPGEENDLPICDVNIYTPQFTEWIYDGKNILNATIRKSIVEQLNDVEYGNLLTGNITKIPAIEFYKTTLENSNSEFGSLFEDVYKSIELINQSTGIPEDTSGILDQVSASNTKGVYWSKTNPPEELINLLNTAYTNSEWTFLSAESAKNEDANLYLTDDKDGIVFALVNTSISANING